MVKFIKFNKSVCGVDLLMNVLYVAPKESVTFYEEIQVADFFQVVFIKRAKGTVTINEKTIDLKDNSIIFISEGQRYFWDVDQSNFDASFLVFQEDFLNEFFSDAYFTFRLLYFYQTSYSLDIIVSEDEQHSFLAKLEEIKHELEFPKSDSVHLVRSILYYLLIQLNRLYADFYELSTAISKENSAYEFRKLVERNIRIKQRVEDYTEWMKMSRISLNKVV